MNSTIFVDTSYILALINVADKYYAEANAIAAVIGEKLLTTEAVLLEFGNALAKTRWRQLAVDTIIDLSNDLDIEILSIDSALFERAFKLYSTRIDKEWSMTDCISFVVMQERSMTEALTADHHFEQAGFRALLRDFKKTPL